MPKPNNKLSIFFLLLFPTIYAQNAIPTELHHVKHAISLVISHTQVNEGLDKNNKKQWLSLPSWGINYNYFISKKWALGLHTDIIVEDFKVEHISRSHETIERAYPIASALVTSYKPGKHFSFLLGSGGEFTKKHNYFLLRAGLEYGVHINSHWELIANLLNDFKLNGYNSWSIGIGIARKL